MKTIGLISTLNLGIILAASFPSVSHGQIISDQTLLNNSVVVSEENIIQIEGGTTRNNNLFHSFEQFSVPVGDTAAFNNAASIDNIFARVTGNSVSNIQGTLETQNSANLFLINPNGIIFGANARLDVGGSFLATTGESIHFADGSQFNTTVTDTPLLTVTAPVGLGLGTNPGKIINRSVLEVYPRNTLALVGGEISIEQEGTLTANEGRVELGALARDNRVSLLQDKLGWKLEYPEQEVETFANINFNLGFIFSEGNKGGDFTIIGRDITFTNLSFIATQSDTGKGGNIELQGRNIVLQQGSQIDSIPKGSEAGNIILKASESVVIEDAIEDSDVTFPSGIFSEVESTATGARKVLKIEAKNLIVRDGGQISTGTFGTGRGVNLIVNASESVTIEGSNFVTGIFAGVLPENTGDGGIITVNTKELVARDGGQISNSTSGEGNAGNLKILASDLVLLEGRDPDTNLSSGIFAQVKSEATGNAGNLTIETSKLTVLDGAQISTAARNTGRGGSIQVLASDSIVLNGNSPFGKKETSFSGIIATAQPESIADSGTIDVDTRLLIVEKGATIAANNQGTGSGGSVNINVERLKVRNGGEIGAGSLVAQDAISNERGSGGTLTIGATETLEVIGKANIRDEIVTSSLFTKAEGTGDAGDLKIYTPKLRVAKAASIDVSATGTGEAGTLFIDTKNNNLDITLDRGSLTAETRTGSQGDITIANADTLLLGDRSQIITNAKQLATGGDIDITSDTIALLDNSNITARAVKGKGGNIQITTQGLFQEPSTAIDAASELGIDGSITINTPDVDPTSSIVELPNVPIDAETILAQDVCKLENDRIAGGSSFIITGRGGLSPTSAEPLDNRDVVGWASRDDLEVSNNGLVGVRQREPQTTSAIYPDIQQSQGWVTTADGSVWLVANAPKYNSQSSGIDHPSCRTKEKT